MRRRSITPSSTASSGSRLKWEETSTCSCSMIRSNEAVTAAKRHFHGKNWHFVAHRRMNGLYWCFVAPPDRGMVFEFDLLSCLRWGPVTFVDRPHVLGRINNFKVDPWASFVKRVLIQLLGGNTAKLQKRPDELGITNAERPVLDRLLPAYFGEALAKSLIQAINHRDFEELRSLIPPLRKAAVVLALQATPRFGAGGGAALGPQRDVCVDVRKTDRSDPRDRRRRRSREIIAAPPREDGNPNETARPRREDAPLAPSYAPFSEPIAWQG